MVVLALAANWFGDSLDGTVARVRQQQRPRYGFYVDHIIDLAGTTMLVAGMAGSGLMNPLVATPCSSATCSSVPKSYLATHASGMFRMSFLGFGPTELRLLLMAGAIRAVSALAFSHSVSAPGAALRHRRSQSPACGLLAAFIVSSVRNTRALYLAEPLPVHSRDKRAA